ncbi:MAG: hypothetical protein HQK99_09605 [Nitrospirae bacterium]|nr:hypothetical protein [Nitrospirota bacterium]
MTALIVSFITGSAVFIWLNVIFARNGFSRGLAMLLSSTVGSIVSSGVYYVVDAVFG